MKTTQSQATPKMVTQFFRLFTGPVCLILLLVPTAQAELVYSEVRPGITASAHYTPGDEEAVPVIILHGFLQTHSFHTVQRLHDSLAESGYALLSPNLSLGIDKRKQSLSCEAIHTHDLDMDVGELAHWVEWLHRKHGKPVVLIGHSAGGVVITRYLETKPESPVNRGVLVSLSYLKGSDKGKAMGPLGDYKLGFCETYPSPPAAFRSYVDWDSSKMLQALQNAHGRVSVILGTADERIGKDWRGLLTEGGVRIVNIEGANHFFDSAHEFDLLEAVEEVLSEEVANG